VSVCHETFINCDSSYSYPLIFTKLGTHDLCANVQETVKHIFLNFDFKIFGEFLNLELVSRTAAAELSRRTDLF